MDCEGGCYCRAVRYRVSGEMGHKLVCFCRECQIVSGGQGTVGVFFPAEAFSWTSGEPARFKRPDLENGVTREFCPACGTHLVSRSPRLPEWVILKAGTLDQPEVYGLPDMAIFTSEMQSWHACPEGVPAFERFPGLG